MKKVKITVLRITRYPDLMEQYENPIEHPCDMQLGSVVLESGTVARSPQWRRQRLQEELAPLLALPPETL